MHLGPLIDGAATFARDDGVPVRDYVRHKVVVGDRKVIEPLAGSLLL